MITRREQEMIDLQDAGLSSAQIAAQMGILEGSVTRTLSMLSAGDGGRSERAALALSSAALVAAIKQFHPEQLLMRPGRRA